MSQSYGNCHVVAQIEGKENLPAADAPAVYVANHQSFMVRSGVNNTEPCCAVLDRKEGPVQSVSQLASA